MELAFVRICRRGAGSERTGSRLLSGIMRVRTSEA